MEKNYSKLNDQLWKELTEHEITIGLPDMTEEEEEHWFRTASASDLLRKEIKINEKAQIEILLREISNAASYMQNGEWLYDKFPKVVVEYVDDYLRKYLKKLEDEK